MEQKKLCIVIMAGGSGTRLWPLSRKDHPKQFQKVMGEQTMLEDTYNRFRKEYDVDDIYISTNSDYREHVLAALPEIKDENILMEPCKRNTASCIALIAGLLAKRHSDTRVMVVPSDHFIQNPEVLLQTMRVAAGHVTQQPESIVTFGIMPTYPEVGYGYIKKGGVLRTHEGCDVHHVTSFVEKPDLETATQYLAEGSYLWNAGMFLFDAEQMVEKFKRHLPGTAARLDEIMAAHGTEQYDDVLESSYAQMEDVSVDYAIIEKDEHVDVIPIALQWSDVGSWASLKDTLAGSDSESISRGYHIDHESQGLIVHNDSDRVIVTVGLADTIVVDHGDAMLVCAKDRAQDVSAVVKTFKGTDKEYLI